MKVYKSKIKRFKTYCAEVGVNPETCPPEIVTNFLAELRRKHGFRYQTICGYRSAISKFHEGSNGNPLGQVKIIKRITRACFLEDPPIPKYGDIWDADILLNYLATLTPHSDLSDIDLSRKTLCLISILSISRSSSLAALGPSYQVIDGEVFIPLVKLEKTGRPGAIRGEARFPANPANPCLSSLSVETCLRDYLDRYTIEK